MSLPFSYEDRYPDYAGSSGYAVTNEEPRVIRQLVRPFRKGLGIASGGEVTFCALLPRVKEELVLVDHSYISLRAFLLKALLITHLGPVAMRKLMIAERDTNLREAVLKVQDMLPERLHTIADNTYLFANFSSLRIEWFYADIASLKRAAANLHKVKVIHGDLMDTADRAPFDFLYLSNALEHAGRPSTPKGYDSKSPDIPALTRMLKPRASILWVTASPPSNLTYGANATAVKSWPVAHSLKNFRNMQWYYNLSRIAKES